MPCNLTPNKMAPFCRLTPYTVPQTCPLRAPQVAVNFTQEKSPSTPKRNSKLTDYFFGFLAQILVFGKYISYNVLHHKVYIKLEFFKNVQTLFSSKKNREKFRNCRSELAELHYKSYTSNTNGDKDIRKVKLIGSSNSIRRILDYRNK